MNRRFIDISLVFLLLISTIGLSVSKHYCGGILMDVAINSHTDGCGEGDMPMGCCTDETQLYAIDDDYQLKNHAFHFQAPAVVLHELNQVINLDLVAFELFNKGNFDPPPLEPETDIYIQVQSFLL